MSIQGVSAKFKTSCKSLLENEELFVSVLLIVVALASFGLGRMSVEQGGGVVEVGSGSQSASVGAYAPRDADTYVASKNGTSYHLPWCAGAQKIKEENKIVFDSREAAEKAGYSPAGNCKGL